MATDTDRPMAHHFREPERRQKALLPADMVEWLPDDIVHLIVEAVGMMDLAKFEASYKLGRAGGAVRAAGAAGASDLRLRAGIALSEPVAKSALVGFLLDGRGAESVEASRSTDSAVG